MEIRNQARVAHEGVIRKQKTQIQQARLERDILKQKVNKSHAEIHLLMERKFSRISERVIGEILRDNKYDVMKTRAVLRRLR